MSGDDLHAGLPARRRTFLLRVWREPAPGDDADGTWRGSVVEVPGGKANHFQGFGGLITTLGRLLDEETRR